MIAKENELLSTTKDGLLIQNEDHLQFELRSRF